MIEKRVYMKQVQEPPAQVDPQPTIVLDVIYKNDQLGLLTGQVDIKFPGVLGCCYDIVVTDEEDLPILTGRVGMARAIVFVPGDLVSVFIPTAGLVPA